MTKKLDGQFIVTFVEARDVGLYGPTEYKRAFLATPFIDGHGKRNYPYSNDPAASHKFASLGDAINAQKEYAEIYGYGAARTMQVLGFMPTCEADIPPMHGDVKPWGKSIAPLTAAPIRNSARIASAMLAGEPLTDGEKARKMAAPIRSSWEVTQDTEEAKDFAIYVDNVEGRDWIAEFYFYKDEKIFTDLQYRAGAIGESYDDEYSADQLPSIVRKEAERLQGIIESGEGDGLKVSLPPASGASEYRHMTAPASTAPRQNAQPRKPTNGGMKF